MYLAKLEQRSSGEASIERDVIGFGEPDQRGRQRGDAQPQEKPFDDPCIRRALTLAIDRWQGAPGLSRCGFCYINSYLS
jgi:hypothetical protein